MRRYIWGALLYVAGCGGAQPMNTSCTFSISGVSGSNNAGSGFAAQLAYGQYQMGGITGQLTMINAQSTGDGVCPTAIIQLADKPTAGKSYDAAEGPMGALHS